MSATTYTRARGPAGRAQEQPRSLRPAEGWPTFALVVVLLVLLAWSIDAAQYRGGRLDWLIWVMVGGASWGFVSAKARLPRWRGHALGAGLGAAVVLVLVAGVVSPAPDLADRFQVLVARAVLWLSDVLGPTRQSQQNVMWQLTCGTFGWATAQHASYAVFGHRRPLQAVTMPGLLLLVNMLIAADVDFVYLVLYTAGALLLLVRMNVFEQRELWIRRRIGEADEVGYQALRSGLAFVSVAVAVAVVLAQVGSSAPLSGLWTGAGHRLEDVALKLNDFFNVAPATRYRGDPFETSQVITGEWDATGADTLRVSTPDGKVPNLQDYLRGTVYDRFVQGDRWLQSDPRPREVPAGSSLLDDLKADGALAADQREALQLRITVLRDLRVVLAPGVPSAVSIDVHLERLGGDGPFAALRPAGGTLLRDSTYEITALVARPGDLGLTKNLLRRAGEDYPPGIVARYAAYPDPDSFSRDPVGHPSVAALAESLVAQLAASERDPFDIADFFQRYLSDPSHFTYNANVRGLCQANESVPDCFLRIRQGYCEYYATTMIVMLRSLGIPSRLAVGYLPPGPNGIVTSSAAHAWVEVYFPGYGWAPFDPTGGNGARPVDYPLGGVALASPSPRSNDEPPIDRNQPRGERPDTTPPTPAAPMGGSPLLPLAVLGATTLAVVLALALVRRRRALPAADPLAVYRSLTRFAGRLGYAPRPTQTVFEYTAGLAGVVPEARAELETVARAKVEATYGTVPLARERLEQVAAAYRRLRLTLLRLVVRRPRHRRR